jgi:tetratricopeptide (TPR) repeat protein
VRALLLSIGWRVGSDLPHMRRIYTESVAAATRAQDDRLLAIAQISLGGCIMKSGGRLDEAADLDTGAVHPARRSGDPGLLATAHAAVSYVYSLVGRLRDALVAADAALELTVDQPELNAGGSVFESPRGLAQQFRAFVLAALGSTGEALTVLNDNEAFIRNRGYNETLCMHAAFKAAVLRIAGAVVHDMRFALEAQAIAESVGGQQVKTSARTTLSAAHLAAAQPVEAAEAARRSIVLIEKLNTWHEWEPLARQVRALALAAIGDPHDGMAEAERAIRCCAKQGNRFFTPWSCAAFAIAAAAAGTELDRALKVLDDGERVVADTDARGFLPELLDARARVHAARGEHEARRETLQRGLQVARENQAHGWEKRFKDALAGETENHLGRGRLTPGA